MGKFDPSVMAKAWALGLPASYAGLQAGEVSVEGPSGDFYGIKNVASNPGLAEMRVWTPAQFSILKEVGVWLPRTNTLAMGGLDKAYYCLRAQNRVKKFQGWHDPLPRYAGVWTFDGSKVLRMLEELDISNLLQGDREYAVDEVTIARQALDAVFVSRKGSEYITLANGQDFYYWFLPTVSIEKFDTATDGATIINLPELYKWLKVKATIEAWVTRPAKQVESVVHWWGAETLLRWQNSLRRQGKDLHPALQDALDAHLRGLSKSHSYVEWSGQVVGGTVHFRLLSPAQMPALQNYCKAKGCGRVVALPDPVDGVNETGALRGWVERIPEEEMGALKVFIEGLSWS